jgi:hypothetical protein
MYAGVSPLPFSFFILLPCPASVSFHAAALPIVLLQVGGRPYLATPKVTAYARKFFACDKLPGAPLEDEGPSFSATSHFEYR